MEVLFPKELETRIMLAMKFRMNGPRVMSDTYLFWQSLKRLRRVHI